LLMGRAPVVLNGYAEQRRFVRDTCNTLKSIADGGRAPMRPPGVSPVCTSRQQGCQAWGVLTRRKMTCGSRM
jgi:hypothetical protein